MFSEFRKQTFLGRVSITLVNIKFKTGTINLEKRALFHSTRERFSLRLTSILITRTCVGTDI